MCEESDFRDQKYGGGSTVTERTTDVVIRLDRPDISRRKPTPIHPALIAVPPAVAPSMRSSVGSEGLGG